MKRFFAALFVGLLLATPAGAATIRIFLTSGTTWTVPVDWNSQDNTIEVIGSGGFGFDCGGVGSVGGGGGGYSKIGNFSAAPGASIAINFTLNDSTGTGAHVWFGSSGTVFAAGGHDGVGSLVCTGGAVKGQGGQASDGVGTTKFSGGDGGSGSGGGSGTGSGGGAAGPHGAGGTTSVDSGIGGAGDAGFGGAGGVSSPMASANGGNGTEYDGSHGSGGGGGSNENGDPTSNGGNYGGGGGYSYAGGGGLIVITYTARRRVSSGVF